jgi:hypothetical protein
MAALAEAGTNQLGRHNFELETRWVQDKKSNCAREVGVVEDILDQRDQGASLGDILKTNFDKEHYYKKVVAHYWHDEASARDTANVLYRYCIDNGTYWSPLGTHAKEKG